MADLANAALYAGQGKLDEAGISVLALAPYVGDGAKLARLGAKASKIEKTTRIEEIGPFRKIIEVRPGRDPGQSRAEYVRIKNATGETIRTYKDSYDRAGNFMGRKPLAGGPEGRAE